MKDENSAALHSQVELKQFGLNKPGEVKVVILDFTNFNCLKGMAPVPADQPEAANDPDGLKMAKALAGLNMIKRVIRDADIRYPHMQYLGIVRRDDADDALWMAQRFLERALPRMNFNASFVDLTLPKSAGGDENVVPPGFELNFNAKI